MRCTPSTSSRVRGVRHFDDLTLGGGGEYGPYAVTEAEILDFARRWDPQWFHTDPQAAKSSIYGGLIASGIHTLAIMSRLMVTGWLEDLADLGSPGLEAVSFLVPVRPGDALRVHIEVIELRNSATRPDRGIARYRITVINQDDGTVLRTGATIFVARRETV